MSEVTQIGADGRRRPVEVEESAPTGVAPAAALAVEDLADPLARGAGSIDPATQIGPDGKRVAQADLEESDVEARPAGVVPGTQITADGSRVPTNEVDPDAPAPRFAASDEPAPKPQEDAAEVADAASAEVRETVQPDAGGGEFVAPEAPEVVTPEPGQLGGEELGNESMPVSPTSTLVPAVGTEPVATEPGDAGDVEPEAEPEGPPAKSALKGAWVDYAVSQGMDRDAAEAKTQDELIAEYGG